MKMNVISVIFDPFSLLLPTMKQSEDQNLGEQFYYLILSYTQSIPNCKSFDFFNIKFDHSSYSKFYTKYHFFVVYWFINKSSSRMT